MGAALFGALCASGCSLILGADKSYYEASAGGAGGGATSTSAATSSASGTGTGGAVNDTCWHGEPLDPGGPEPCGPTSLAALADNFNDNQVGPLWVVYEINATAQEVNHQAVVSIPGPLNKFAGFTSKSTYSLLGCHGSIEVVQAPQHPSTVAHFSLSPDPSSGADVAEVHQVGKSLAFSLTAGGVATDDCVIPYSTISHRFWRIREASGDLLWETAPNGATWTVQRRAKAPTFAAAVRVDFGVITLGNDVAGVGIFDNFDLP